MTRTISTLAAAVIIAACAPKADAPPVAAADPAAVRAIIDSTERAWSAAYLKGDATAVAALYASDAATVDGSGDWRRGRDAIVKEMQAELDTTTVETRSDVSEEVTVAGDYAVEIGQYAWTGKSKASGAALGDSGRYMVLWRKDADGVWRLFRDMGTTGVKSKP